MIIKLGNLISFLGLYVPSTINVSNEAEEASVIHLLKTPQLRMRKSCNKAKKVLRKWSLPFKWFKSDQIPEIYHDHKIMFYRNYRMQPHSPRISQWGLQVIKWKCFIITIQRPVTVCDKDNAFRNTTFSFYIKSNIYFSQMIRTTFFTMSDYQKYIEFQIERAEFPKEIGNVFSTIWRWDK